MGKGLELDSQTAIYKRVVAKFADLRINYHNLALEALKGDDLDAFTVYMVCGTLLKPVEEAAQASAYPTQKPAEHRELTWPSPESVSHVS